MIINPVEEGLTIDVGRWTAEVAGWTVWDERHSRCTEGIGLGGGGV